MATVAEAGPILSRELLPGLSCGFKGPRTWAHSSAFPSAVTGNWIRTRTLALQLAPIWNANITGNSFTHYSTVAKAPETNLNCRRTPRCVCWLEKSKHHLGTLTIWVPSHCPCCFLASDASLPGRSSACLAQSDLRYPAFLHRLTNAVSPVPCGVQSAKLPSKGRCSEQLARPCGAGVLGSEVNHVCLKAPGGLPAAPRRQQSGVPTPRAPVLLLQGARGLGSAGMRAVRSPITLLQTGLFPSCCWAQVLLALPLPTPTSGFLLL